MSRALIGLATIVGASLAIVGGSAAAPSAATSQSGNACAAVSPTTATNTFGFLGDGAMYIQASSGTTQLEDGGSLTTACTRTSGIQAVVRFYARSVTGAGAIHVQLITNHGSTVLDGGLVAAGSTLAPVDTVAIPWDRAGRGASDVQVVLTSVGGRFEIGSIYIDPYVQK